MDIFTIKRKVMDMYRKVDESINEEIRMYGCVSLFMKGKKTALVEVLIMLDDLACDGWG